MQGGRCVLALGASPLPSGSPGGERATLSGGGLGLPACITVALSACTSPVGSCRTRFPTILPPVGALPSVRGTGVVVAMCEVLVCLGWGVGLCGSCSP
eukprot:4436728-Pyramimonas_sp.AAC.1